MRAQSTTDAARYASLSCGARAVGSWSHGHVASRLDTPELTAAARHCHGGILSASHNAGHCPPRGTLPSGQGLKPIEAPSWECGSPRIVHRAYLCGSS